MKVKVLNLKPTQFAVGMDEVEYRVKELDAMTPRRYSEYLHSHKIPVIRGPEGLYLIDKHHLIRACWESDIDEVPVVIKANLSKSKHFWSDMAWNNWVYLTNQFGRYTNPTELPRTVRCLGDNPWRSLAWKVRVKGGFDKSTEPFAEFKWAEFFRKHCNHIDVKDVKAALSWCHSPLAANLPGYKYGTKTTTRSK